MRIPLRRAIVSVSDKTGVEELARALDEAGCRIVSTGTTASAISEAGIPVTEVSALTGFPECLDGRVKTLHPAVHAGILADRRKASHVRQLADLGIAAFDLVVVNLYPFRQAVASGAGFEECVEKIDIGGPAMVRAAAKNHASVAVVTDPADYGAVIEAAGKGGFEDGERLRLAAKAFAHTAAYDAAVAEWISEGECAGGVFTRRSTLRYGENPHQAAAVYTDGTGGLAQAEQLGGKEMSYNNYQDVDAALRAAYDHAGPAVAVVKHANPCGLAVGEDVADAYRRAHACDPVSAYGGVIAANREVSAEAIAAPGFAPEALDILSRKKNLRILRVGELDPTRDVRPISGGILLQDRDLIDAPGDDPASWTLVSGDPADGPALRDLEFAWRAVRAVKSNAILLARDGASVGIGMGQVNRVDSCRLAVTRAGDRAAGAVAASDAYFPFADGFEVLARAGVRAVVQPGGSIRDEEVISSARASSVTMYLTGTRHFAH